MVITIGEPISILTKIHGRKSVLVSRPLVISSFINCCSSAAGAVVIALAVGVAIVCFVFVVVVVALAVIIVVVRVIGHFGTDQKN